MDPFPIAQHRATMEGAPITSRPMLGHALPQCYFDETPLLIILI